MTDQLNRIDEGLDRVERGAVDALTKPAGPDRSSERTNISAADLRNPGTRWGYRIVTWLTIAALVVVSAGPLLWLAKSALSTTQDTIAQPFALWPSGIQWGNLAEAWNTVRIGQYTLNTAIMTGGAVVFSIVICVTCAYVLAILRPRWAVILDALVMATLFVPAVISLIPLYLTVIDLNLLDSYWAVWLPHAASAFSVLVLKNYFSSLPREIFEAAKVDGAGPIRILLLIVTPMSKPILGVVALLTFTAVWKDFLWPLLALPSPDKQPLSVALTTIAPVTDQAILLAAMFITVIIPIVLFLVFQRQFLRGAGSSGAVKG
jgi:multiple sugar transport system permease protein